MNELLRSPFTLLDGGMSTALEEMGEHPAGPLWTAAALMSRPEMLTAAHRRYVDAGADVLITSSYQASVPGLVAAGVPAGEARRLLASTTGLARAAAGGGSRAAGEVVVAASVGPYGAYLADGSEYRGDYVTSGAATWDGIRAFHRARLEVLVDTGPDAFAIETMPLRAEAEIVVEELRRLTDAPAWVTFSCADEVHTCGGEVLADAAVAVAPAVTAVGVNCTAPRLVTPLLASVREALGGAVPLVAYPNHGATWDGDHKCWVGPAGGSELPALALDWIATGARLIGGCCGVGSDGIRGLADLRSSLAGAR